MRSRRYAYSYTVTVINTGRVAAQLISRHWIITDGAGKVEEVRGLGVVGQQPFLKPGEAFEYTSWSQLSTPMGSMRGSYFCVAKMASASRRTFPNSRWFSRGVCTDVFCQARARKAAARAATEVHSLLDAASAQAQPVEQALWIIELLDWLRRGP
jgi:Uncharacterized protein affecting Mg2+/Co2+ transport